MANGTYNSFPINWETLDASDIPYDNTQSGLEADNIQSAIDETVAEIVQKVDELAQDVDDNYAKQVGSYDELSAGTASGIIGKSGVTDTVPYTYRAIPHDSTREVMRKIVGATVGWNQLVTASYKTATIIPNGTATYSTVSGMGFTSKPNHVYFIHTDITYNGSKFPMRAYCQVGSSDYGRPAIDITSAGGKSCDWLAKRTATISQVSLGISNITTSDKLTDADQWTYDNAMYIDLTAMLGTAIADYVNSLETATAGAGVAWLKSHFPKAFNVYQPYDAGSLKSVEGLVSHDTVGFNQWDEEWELGGVNVDTGEKTVVTDRIRSKNYVPVTPSTQYYFTSTFSTDFYIQVLMFDENKAYLGRSSGYVPVYKNASFTTVANCHYLLLGVAPSYGTTYNNDICINLSDASRNGQYEPYVKHSYPLDPTQTLRGIFKLDASNNLYADGDEWYADGRKDVRYGIVDLGTLSWNYATSAAGTKLFISTTPPANIKPYPSGVPNIYDSKYTVKSWSSLNAGANAQQGITIYSDGSVRIVDPNYTDAATFKTAMSGVMLVYELATTTESTAPSFADVQIIDPDGTEEFVTDCIVAVGNETFYADDLVGKLDDLPALPVEAGTYRLKVTVTAGVPSYEWVTT